jgi:hypothetical protein
MAYVTRAMRERVADERARRTPGPCGHSIVEYREYQPSFTLEDGEIVTTPHPRYRPLLFICGVCGREATHGDGGLA